MKRTQLYIEEDIFKTLEDISRKQAVSISELVRKAIKKMYIKKMAVDEDTILKEASGIWKDRKDILSTEDYVRKMRRNTRRERFGIK